MKVQSHCLFCDQYRISFIPCQNTIFRFKLLILSASSNETWVAENPILVSNHFFFGKENVRNRIKSIFNKYGFFFSKTYFSYPPKISQND